MLNFYLHNEMNIYHLVSTFSGASSQVNVCNISGEITAKILASCSCVYDVHVLEHPNTVCFLNIYVYRE